MATELSKKSATELFFWAVMGTRKLRKQIDAELDRRAKAGK